MKKYILVALFFLIASYGLAAERITDFSVHMRVNADASAEITETISIVAEHQRIKRGIYRDLPREKGITLRNISLKMDGDSHPFFLENKAGSTRINFGDNNYLSQGPHTYQLHYKMDHLVDTHRKYDEIYWNVTGEGWVFPIEQASFRLELPEGATPIEEGISSYVGRAGTKGTPAYRRGLFFETYHTIQPGSGFTVAVPIQKGIIHVDHTATYKVLAGLSVFFLLLWGYYGWAWNRVGRDPKARVYTRYEPPRDISPAQAGYIYSMGMNEDRLFPAAIVSMVMKGAVSIKEKTSFFKGRQIELIKHRVKKQNYAALSSEEMVARSALFQSEERTSLDKADIPDALKKFANSLENSNKSYFITNEVYNLPTYLCLVLVSILLSQRDFVLFAILLVAQIIGMIGMYYYIVQKHIHWYWKLLVLGVFVVAPQILLVVLFPTWNPAWSVFVLLVIVSGGLFMQWIKCYSVAGREIMDHIEGFKHYLEVGEKGRIEMSNPTDALRIFCDYLPYAFALGVQSKWMRQFKRVFSKQQLDAALHSRGFRVVHVASFSRCASGSFGGRGSGSFGGGHVGGGHGGGGGGGR